MGNFNPSTRRQRQRQADLCEIRASLVYTEFQNSRSYVERI